jgi:hypothetical protein
MIDEAEMRGIFPKLKDLAAALTRCEPVQRSGTDKADWMPPVISLADCTSYFLAMAHPGAGWYIERHRRHHD